MAHTSPRLETLKQKQQSLSDQMRREQLRLRKKARNDDTRRKIIWGAESRNLADEDPHHYDVMMERFNRNLTRDDDRALFGLDPLPKPATKV